MNNNMWCVCVSLHLSRKQMERIHSTVTQLLEICPAPSIIVFCMMPLPKPSTSTCLFDSSAHYEKKEKWES